MPASLGPDPTHIIQTLERLAVGPPDLAMPTVKVSAKKEEVADSWEDEIEVQDEPTPNALASADVPAASLEPPAPPPPTPATPFQRKKHADQLSTSDSPFNPPSEPPSKPDRRPEKTTATANRMIASALGVRVPPKTDEQKQYERAVKENVKKEEQARREQRAKAEEEKERARQAMWDG